MFSICMDLMVVCVKFQTFLTYQWLTPMNKSGLFIWEMLTPPKKGKKQRAPKDVESMSMELRTKITQMRNSMEDAKKSEDQDAKKFEVVYSKMREISVEHIYNTAQYICILFQVRFLLNLLNRKLRNKNAKFVKQNLVNFLFQIVSNITINKCYILKNHETPELCKMVYLLLLSFSSRIYSSKYWSRS